MLGSTRGNQRPVFVGKLLWRTALVKERSGSQHFSESTALMESVEKDLSSTLVEGINSSSYPIASPRKDKN